MKPGRGKEWVNAAERSKIVSAGDGNDGVYYRIGKERKGRVAEQVIGDGGDRSWVRGYG